MSDAIVISIPMNRKSVGSLAELLIAICKIQYTLCKNGIWLRGAVSFGDIFINKEHSVVVGLELAEAYLVENLRGDLSHLDDSIFVDYLDI